MVHRSRHLSPAAGVSALFLVAACQSTGSFIPGGANIGGDARLISALDGGLISKITAVQLASPDQRQALASEYRALEYAAPDELVTWQSGLQAIAGQVSASQPYRVGSQDCRQYSHRIFNTAAGANASQPALARGTACRNPDGSWTLLT